MRAIIQSRYGAPHDVLFAGGKIYFTAEAVRSLYKYGKPISAIGEEAVHSHPVGCVRIDRYTIDHDAGNIHLCADRCARTICICETV